MSKAGITAEVQQNSHKCATTAAAQAQQIAEERRRCLIGNLNRVPAIHNLARRHLDPFEPIKPFSAGAMDVYCDHCESPSFSIRKFQIVNEDPCPPPPPSRTTRTLYI